MYLEKNDAQFTLSPISDGKEPSRLWKIAEDGSLKMKIDDYSLGVLEQPESNVISIVVSGVGAYLQNGICRGVTTCIPRLEIVV